MSQLTKLESLRYRFSKGDVIAHQGDESEGLILIESGTVRFEVDGKVVGKMALSATNPDFEFLGEVSALLNTPVKATAIAETECSLVIIPADKLEGILKVAPSLGIKLAQSLCKKLVAATEAMFEAQKNKAA